jgi:hypothetical protein
MWYATLLWFIGVHAPDWADQTNLQWNLHLVFPKPKGIKDMLDSAREQL